MDKISLLGISFDYGQPKSGVREAADYLRYSGLVSALSSFASVDDMGNLLLPQKSKDFLVGPIKHRNLCSEANALISEVIGSMDLESNFLLNVGGDHGMGLGTIHGMLLHDPDTVVVWADAHGDINTPETSNSGNFHGMPLSFLLGLARDDIFHWQQLRLKAQNLIYFGPRDLEPAELKLIENLNIQYFSTDEINDIGASIILETALKKVDPFGSKPIHLSFDVDLFDGDDFKSTGIRLKDGPRIEEVFLMGGILGETGRLRSMDIVEFNPSIGNDKVVRQSAEIISDFLVVTLGQAFPRMTHSSNRSQDNFIVL